MKRRPEMDLILRMTPRGGAVQPPHVKISARTSHLISNGQSCLASQPREDVVFDVKIERLEGLPRRSFIRIPGKRHLYVTLNLGPISEKTQSESQGPDGVVTWGQTFTVTVAAGSKFTPKVVLWQAHKHSNDEKVAVASDLDLVEMSQKRGVSIELHNPADEAKGHGRLFIDVRINLPDPKSPTSSIGTRAVQSPTQTQFAKVSPVCQSWQPFLQAFRQAVEVARQISELDPTAKIALGAISFAITALVKQIERDQRVNELQEIMTSLLLFFGDVEPLQQSPFLRSALDGLLRQVSECTYFILQYREIESFVERTAVHLTTDTDGILDRFFTSFTTLRAELALGASLQTTINTEYILNKINDIDVFLRIKSFQHLTGCSWRSDKQCVENTRDFTINRILRWVSSFHPSLFMLSGSPGSGKSSVLHGLANILDRRGRLGAGIFLNEFTKGEKTADSLMRTLLYYVASSYPSLGEKVASAIAQRPSLDYADANRYSELLEEVTRDLVLYGPLVVIVDGLQELETTRDQQLVQTILTRLAKSGRSNLRFIMASTLSMDIPGQNNDCTVWEIGSPISQLTKAEAFVQRSAPALADIGIFDRYDRLQSAELISQHPQKFGSSYWISYACRLLIDAPCLWDALLKRATPPLPFPFLPEGNDEAQFVAFAATVLDLTVLDNDFLSLVPGSRLFVQSHLPKHSLHNLGLIRKINNPPNNNFEEYEIDIPRSISEMMSPINAPFFTTDFPLNIYEFCLRYPSGDGLSPVYARIASPVGEPLMDGQDIEKGFYRYGIGVTGFREMSANSPKNGCEWIILHHKLFRSETKDGFTSIMVTTPVITREILEQLVCIWVYWGNWAEEEGTCMQLRDGKEKEGFLADDTYTKVVYKGTHSELFQEKEKKGELQPGDRITVRARYKQGLKLRFIGVFGVTVYQGSKENGVVGYDGVNRVVKLEGDSKGRSIPTIEQALGHYRCVEVAVPKNMKANYKFSNICGTVYRQGNVLFTSDGNSLLSPVGNRVSVFDLVNNKSFTFPFENRKNIARIALSPDSNVLISVDEDGRALLVNFRRGVVLHHFNFKKPVKDITFSPDGKFIAVTHGSHVQVWKTPNHLVREFAPFELYRTYTGHHDEVLSIQWARDSKCFITTSRDMTARLFTLDPLAGFRPKTFAGHRDAVLNAYFSADGSSVYTVARDGAVYTWRAKSSVDSDEDEEMVSASESDSSSSSSSHEPSSIGIKIARTRWGIFKKHYLSPGSSEKGSKVPLHHTKVTTTAYHAPSSLLICGFSTGIFTLHTLSTSSTMSTLDPIHTLSISNQKLTSVTISPSGEWLGFGSSTLGQLVVWEWQSESYVLKQQGHWGEMSCLAYSPSSSTSGSLSSTGQEIIATGSSDGSLKLWSPSSGFCFLTFSNHSAAISGLDFAPNGAVLFSSSLDGTVRAFDLIRYRNFRTFTSPTPTQFSCISVDPSGEVVAAGSATSFEIYLWSVSSGRLIDVLSGHEGPVSCLGWEVGGNGGLISGSWDGTVRVWSVFTRTRNVEPVIIGSDVLSLAIRPDGGELAVATLNGSITFFTLDSSSNVGGEMKQTNVIDGRRDVAGGRKVQERLSAKNSTSGKAFTSLTYTADGKCLLAGGRSKWVCLYDVREGEGVLVKKFQVSENLALDGVEEFADSRKINDAGINVDLIDTRGEEEELAERLDSSLPGARGAAGEEGDQGKRRYKPEAKTSCVRFSPSGREWAAASTDGLLIYSLDSPFDFSPSFGSMASGSTFDPYALSIDLTPQAVLEWLEGKEYVKALIGALNLNERGLIGRVFYSIPVGEVSLVSRQVGEREAIRLLRFVGEEVGEGGVAMSALTDSSADTKGTKTAATTVATKSPHLEFGLRWILALLRVHGRSLRQGSSRGGQAGGETASVLRVVRRSLGECEEGVAKICDENTAMLGFLLDQQRKKSEHQAAMDVDT